MELKPFEDKMKKTVTSLEDDFATIRAGRANPRVLDRISIDYFGTITPLNQVGNISVPEPRMIQIAPWDASTLKGIEKAIQTSDLGITPNNDGKVIRIIFPELTEERRKDLTKEIKKKGEDAKVSVRNIRREANEAAKKAEKAKEITEDDLKRLEKDTQTLTDKYIAELDKKVEEKSKEIMTV